MSALLATNNTQPAQDFMGYNPQTLINTAQEFVYQDKNLTPTALDTYLKNTFKLTPQETNYILSNIDFGSRPAEIAPPSLTYATKGFTDPSQGGLAYAVTKPTQFPAGATDYYKNIAAYMYQPNVDLSPTGVAKVMKESGVTTDDIIRATGLFPNPNTPTTPTTTVPVTTDQTVDGSGGGGSFAKGGETKYIEPLESSEIPSILLPKSPAPLSTVPSEGTNPITNKPLTYKSEIVNPLDAALAVAMRKYGLSDFGLQQPNTNVFPYEKQILYSPLKGIEALLLTDPKIRAAQKPYQYTEGGGVDRGLGSIAMKGYAEELRRQGRNGDTMLAHINPQEAKMLEAMGGSGTINPATGLPEYGFSWKKLLKAAQFVVPFIPGIGLPLKVALSGLAGGFAGPGKGFDFKRGLISGAMAFAGGKLAEGLTAAGQLGSTGANTIQSLGGQDLLNASAGFDAAGTNFDLATPAGAPISAATNVMPGVAPGPSMGAKILDAGQSMYKGAENLISGAPGSSEAFKQAAGYAPSTLAAANAVGPGLLAGADESTKYQLQLAIANAKTEEERRYYEDLARRLLPGFAVGGGISALVAGGATGPANAPRTINGAGDGMSDSVPATIEGIQEARLADGEFVIPADVVADLGNGSSNAGSKKLYAMMDRIRNSRHGTTEQPPEVDTGRLMPA